MLSPLARGLLAATLLLFASASGTRAQMDLNSLAPQDGMSISVPSPLESSPDQQRRNQTLAPFSPGSQTKTVLSLSALFFDKSAAIETGLRWRVFSDQPDFNGNHALVFETIEAKPFITLDPGGYIVHVVYGLASATRHVVLGTESVSEEIALNAGALRFTGTVGNKTIPPAELSFEIHRADANTEELVAQVKAGELLRLKAGAYQVTSTYGQANAKIISEVRVEPGKLTEAAVLHKAGRVDLRLIANGHEIPDATWSLLTPGGDVVSETLPAARDLVLAEGEYVAVARYEGRIFQKPFEVHSGRAEKVDVAASMNAVPQEPTRDEVPEE
jgi:hypothetical protein